LGANTWRFRSLIPAPRSPLVSISKTGSYVLSSPLAIVSGDLGLVRFYPSRRRHCGTIGNVSKLGGIYPYTASTDTTGVLHNWCGCDDISGGQLMPARFEYPAISNSQGDLRWIARTRKIGKSIFSYRGRN